MKRLMLGGALVAAMALPSAAAAEEPTPAEFKNASKQCKAMKKASGAANFKALYKSHGKCVSSIAKQKAATEEKQEQQAKTNAAKQCKELRDQDKAAFSQQYKNLGKCVSEKAKQNKAEADKEEAQEDKARVNAAKQCKKEKKDAEQFAADYGSKKNAFGKCVSKKAQAQEDEPTEG